MIIDYNLSDRFNGRQLFVLVFGELALHFVQLLHQQQLEQIAHVFVVQLVHAFPHKFDLLPIQRNFHVKINAGHQQLASQSF